MYDLNFYFSLPGCKFGEYDLIFVASIHNVTHLVSRKKLILVPQHLLKGVLQKDQFNNV